MGEYDTTCLQEVGWNTLKSRPVEAVCIDFHNTIAICDSWFELEIHELVPAYLQWLMLSTGVIFDESLRTQGRQLYRTLRAEVMESGIEIDAGESLRVILESLNVEVAPTCIATGLEAIMRPTLQTTRPVAGAIELIESIHANDIPVVVVSSAVYHEFLVWTLEMFGISQNVQAIISSARAGIYKSSPDIYIYAASTLGVEPAACVHIGDSHRFDVVTAKRAGMRTIWLTEDGGVEANSADMTVRSLNDIPISILNGHW